MDNEQETGIVSRRDILRVFGMTALGASALAAGSGVVGGLSGLAMAAGQTETWRQAGRDVLSVIHERRSYRAFTKEAVAEEDLKEILFAGMSAPNTHNCRPWQLIVLNTPEAIERIVSIVPKASFMTTAGAVIIPCLDSGREEVRENPRESLLFSMACCGMNMLLAAEALNYGAVWVELMPNADKMAAVQNFIGLPKSVEPVCFLPIGRPSTKIMANRVYEENRVHYNKWGVTSK